MRAQRHSVRALPEEAHAPNGPRQGRRLGWRGYAWARPARRASGTLVASSVVARVSADPPDGWRAFHERCLVVDGHDDLMVDVMRRRLRGETEVLRRVHLPKLRSGGVDVVFLTCGGDHSTMFDGADQPVWSD